MNDWFAMKKIDEVITNAFGYEAMLDKKSNDDMVTIITNPYSVDLHKLDDIMVNMGYIPYSSSEKKFLLAHYVHNESADKYSSGEELKKRHFDTF